MIIPVLITVNKNKLKSHFGFISRPVGSGYVSILELILDIVLIHESLFAVGEGRTSYSN